MVSTASGQSSLTLHWWMPLVRGLIAIVFGIVLFAFPISAVAALVILFGAYAFVDGVLVIVQAFRFAHPDTGRWWWLLAQGIAGILIGVGVCLLPFAETIPLAFAVMAFVGICSGIFVVPLDALLQREGEAGVGAGSAIAIQNMFENLSMLALVSGYSAMVFLKTPVNDIAVAVGLFIALSMTTLTLTSRPSVKTAR